jgi:tetratricopeptide (TPR) repeat protein
VKGQALYGSDYPAALAAFDAAIARDGRYGAALAARARTLGVMANIEANPARAAARRRDAMATARRAIEIAPTMAEGHAALGFLLLSQLEFEAARGPYQKSFELGLGNAPILASYAEFSAYTGDFGHADAAIERSVKLDPLNPAIFRSAGVVALLARRPEAARTAAQTALSLNPRIRVAHHTLGDVALLAGDYAEARAQFALEPDRLTQLRGLAIADAKLRGPAAGDAQMATLVREFGDGGLYQQVQVLAQWGQIEAALAALDRAVAARDSGLVLALKDPMLDPLREQPRFQAVLTGLGLTDKR